MKRTAVMLGILALLLLSACRIDGAGVETPPPATPRPSPTEETKPPPEPTPPQPTATQEPEETAPPALTAEQLTALAIEWCETHAARFSGYDAVRIDRDFWFAEYRGEAREVPFTPSDGGDGLVRFLPNPDGALSPAQAAAQLLGQPENQMILVDRERVAEEMGHRLAAHAGEGLNEASALTIFLQNAQYTPALMEDTWYCVSADDTGYILMSHAGAYRLQRLTALIEYATAPEFQVRISFGRAAEAYGWLTLSPLPKDESDGRPDPDGSEAVYSRVNAPGFSTMLELRTYLKTLFSDEIVDTLFSYGKYREFDGVLYVSDAVPPLSYRMANPAAETEVARESASRVLYRQSGDGLVLNYVYELVGDGWLFTEFPYME